MTTDPTARLNAALEGRYHIERELGAGGMATVYLARDLKHNRNVALKVLSPELAAVVGAERFLAEIETTANLQHPHILPLFDSGEADSFLFYVMPYVEGESLRERLDREHQLPVEEAVAIASRVAGALQAAHERGVIHRDIKPANILLSKGEPLVSDFGIALAVGAAGGGRLTETGLSLGTPHYMSPEQATGDMSVGTASDIYALGCVLYEMLVGEPPHTGSTAQAVLGKIVTGDSDPVSKHRRSVPPNVDAAVSRALEKVPADRFSSASAFATALGDAGFRHGSALSGTGSRDRRTSWGIAGAAAVLASLVTGSLVWMLAAARGPEASPLVSRFTVEVPVTGSFRPTTVQFMELSRDGRLLFMNVLDGDGSQIYVRPLASLEARAIPGTRNGGSFFVSPDGRSIAVNMTDGTLRRIPVDGGQPITIASGLAQGGGWRGGHWGADGSIVFSTSTSSGLMRVSDAGGTPERITEHGPTEGSHWAPQLLPDGEHVLYGIVEPDREVVRLMMRSLRTGEESYLADGTYVQYIGGYIVFDRGGALWAAELDVGARRLVGEPRPVLEGLRPSSGNNRSFSVAQDGTLVYLAAVEGGAGNRALVWVNREGGEVTTGLPIQPYMYPRLSPTGDRLAVAVPGEVSASIAPTDLWIYDLARLAPTRVTYGDTDNRYYPIWTPDGGALTHADGAGDANRILVSPATGVGASDTILEGFRSFPTSWSPDGQALAFYAGPAGTPTNSRDLFVLRRVGATFEAEPYLATSFQDRAPVFSPDGRWIAYVSDKSGRNEVYVAPYPGPGAEYTISTTGGSEPVWSRDGTELFFRTEDALMVVGVQLGQSFSTGAAQMLFEDAWERDAAAGSAIPNYDVSPDGQRFLMVRPDIAQGSDELVVVQDWVAELREALSN